MFHEIHKLINPSCIILSFSRDITIVNSRYGLVEVSHAIYGILLSRVMRNMIWRVESKQCSREKRIERLFLALCSHLKYDWFEILSYTGVLEVADWLLRRRLWKMLVTEDLIVHVVWKVVFISPPLRTVEPDALYSTCNSPRALLRRCCSLVFAIVIHATGDQMHFVSAWNWGKGVIGGL